MNRYRLIMFGLGALLVATVALAWSFWPAGEALVIPDQVQSIQPGPGDQVPRQVPLTIDLEPGFDVRLFIDFDGVWVEVPREEIDRGRSAGGVYVWAPGPGRTLEEWRPDQRVRVLIESLSGVVTVDELTWAFRTY